MHVTEIGLSSARGLTVAMVRTSNVSTGLPSGAGERRAARASTREARTG